VEIDGEEMTDDTRREYNQLKALAKFGRYKIRLIEHELFISAIADFLQLRKKRPRPSEAQIALGQAALKAFHTRHRAQNEVQNTTNGGEEVFQHADKKFSRF
jgi:hypothetical protein